MSCSSSVRLIVEDSNDPYSVWNKLFDEEMRQQILKWTNVKISEFRNKFSRGSRPELKDLDSIELNAFWVYYSTRLS